MQRSKPYPLWLMFMDIFLFLVTGGAWIFIVIPREILRFSQPPKRPHYRY